MICILFTTIFNHVFDLLIVNFYFSYVTLINSPKGLKWNSEVSLRVQKYVLSSAKHFFDEIALNFIEVKDWAVKKYRKYRKKSFS